MKQPEEILIKDFDYYLPDEKIAKYALQQRDESKLLVYEKGNIRTDNYFNLEQHLASSSLLVFNDTKVIAARLIFSNSENKPVEIFCLEPADKYKDITTGMLEKGSVTWKCLVGGAKKWKENILKKEILSGNIIIEIAAEKLKKEKDYFLIRFAWSETKLSFSEILEYAGEVPLPPYLNRKAEETDIEQYQTIYAKFEGSVAAPTAGLHFTERLLKKLAANNISTDFVTLHVGAGTFKPVKTARVAEHEMHAEYIEVSRQLLENMLKHTANKIIAVGTTSLRTLESLYWLGVKTLLDPDILPGSLQLDQWEAYEMNDDISYGEALSGLLKWMNSHALEKLGTKTKIIIMPGYEIKSADGLITNFHQPQSTLLLLVAAFVQEDWRKIYAYALANDFRFLSYGDGSLIWKR